MTLVVDTSAIVCLLLGEPDAPRVAEALQGDPDLVMSAATHVELMLAAESRKGPAGALKVGEIMREAQIEIVEHGPPHADAAIDGWRRFGKGRHPAGLNLGDCFTYGLARVRGAPVVCVGTDFALTDVEVLPERT